MASVELSVTDLAAFADQRACPRCLWVRLHVKRLPYQVFPGIFSSIDSYNKRVVHEYFQQEGRLPSWLAELGDVAQQVPPPSYQSFAAHDPATDVLLRGTADAVFRMRDGSYTIVDYKTARFTAEQAARHSVYVAQLNGYAYIGHRLELRPVSQLALVYMEPVTNSEAAPPAQQVDSRGFSLALAARVVQAPVDPEGIIAGLLVRAKSLYQQQPPLSAPGCKDCDAAQALLAVWRS